MYPRAPRLAALILLGLLPLGSLSACGGGDSQAEPPPLSLTPSATPTSTAPTVAPPGETAREFVHRWFELDEYAQATGDTREYRALGATCQGCRQFADKIEQIYEDGGSISPGVTRVNSMRRLPAIDGFEAFRLTTSVSAGSFKARADGETKRLPGGTIQYQIVVERDGASWRMHEFSLVAKR